MEKELGYKLPASYIWLMKQHNGGIPVNTCFPTNEPTSWAADHVPITGIFGIGREKIYSLCGALGSRFMIDEWNYPAIGVAICDCPSAGHDMIFLDYRACGPHGEPAVVHVDRENDYKITHLADSFELFICGLKHESLYESDEDDTDSSVDNNYSSDSAGAHINNGEDENADSLKDSFSGFVLLSKGRWHKQQFIRDMKEKWDICVKEDDDMGEQLAAVICISDPLRAEAKEVLATLRELGISNTVMLTGDSHRTAAAIAAQVGVDDFRSEVLPADKADYVARLRQEGHTVLMVGDGINDSPALSEADAGIAISDGAAIAREIADITIAADSLWELVELRQIAMALMARIHSNYRFVIGFNGTLIALGMAGIIPPATSAMLHNISTLGVSLRSMSALPLAKKKPL